MKHHFPIFIWLQYMQSRLVQIDIANIVNTPRWYRQLVFDVTARDQLMAQIECHQFIVEMDFNCPFSNFSD